MKLRILLLDFDKKYIKIKILQYSSIKKNNRKLKNYITGVGNKIRKRFVLKLTINKKYFSSCFFLFLYC